MLSGRQRQGRGRKVYSNEDEVVVSGGRSVVVEGEEVHAIHLSCTAPYSKRKKGGKSLHNDEV
jgi:hypothetical protein